MKNMSVFIYSAKVLEIDKAVDSFVKVTPFPLGLVSCNLAITPGR